MPFYIAGDVDAHVQPPGWHDDLDLYRAYVVSLMSLLALAACVRRQSGSVRAERGTGWGPAVCAVVSIALPILLVFGVSLTRATELDRAERTGWGLWIAWSCLHSAW